MDKENLENEQNTNNQAFDESKIQELISRSVAEATAGLKTNRDEILREKREIEDRLKQYEAEREKLNPLLSMLESQKKDEKLKAIVDGKMTLEDYENQVKSKFQEQWQSEVSQKEQEVNALREELEREKRAIIENNVKTEFANAFLKHPYADPESLEDLQILVKNEITYKDGRVVIVDKSGNERMISGKPMTMEQFVEEQAQVRKRNFKLPAGSGSGSSAGNFGGRKTVSRASFNKMLADAYSVSETDAKKLLESKAKGEIVIQ